MQNDGFFKEGVASCATLYTRTLYCEMYDKYYGYAENLSIQERTDAGGRKQK